MDMLSHILLNNLVYKDVVPSYRFWAILFGIAPDMVGFGIMFKVEYLKKALFYNKMPHNLIPRAVFVIYNAAHSLVLWLIVFGLLYLLGQQWWALLWCGWAIHIVVDIFTHGANSFPTKIFWPLSDWYFPGFAWSQRNFLILNYSVFAILYALFYF
ncbi:hypothetical protein COT94_02240 [Candidatus Falkowbacteria bacterium CG10_big_fil_rev_8_21_14_0_10_37_14]|uniref:Metal-dependent hydrolase n=1 Tax=Candidatus Falkowbacteria bacterium CG10_big_fil_rev_8_21_14_0_10_37_14 TaxID=1974561 RepID=A0A2M6WTE7_9BACT|nr:hypothetical protein [Candidatus Falkowbacteria bacterium]PIT96060.1 MAG: hypothetical protein COT94_02240 [Candidatus Falkowbacteria bacterium CG10_big_fil_rev_8_21_14_0_10_37_14]